MSMSVNEVLDVLNDHENWCGTYYGRNWKHEKDVLETCKSAIKFQISLEEKTAEDLPPDNLEPVLVQYSGTSINGVKIVDQTGIAWYADGTGWCIPGAGMLEFEIHRWRKIPEWSE